MSKPMSKKDAEKALRAFFLYEKKYHADRTAFSLPSWFSEAESHFEREEIQKMWNEEHEVENGSNAPASSTYEGTQSSF